MKAQQQNKQTQIHDITPQQGDEILTQAEKYKGTPYVYGGNSKSGIDCSHLVCKAVNGAGISMPYTTSKLLGKSVNVRVLGPHETPRTGDIALWPGHHEGIYDSTPPRAGYNILSATTHGGVRFGPASWFSFYGKPEYLRVVVP